MAEYRVHLALTNKGLVSNRSRAGSIVVCAQLTDGHKLFGFLLIQKKAKRSFSKIDYEQYL